MRKNPKKSCTTQKWDKVMTPYPMFPLLSVKWSLSRGLKQKKRGSEYSDLTWKLLYFREPHAAQTLNTINL